MRKNLQILGIRGIPGNHGGFESFAERLAPYLVNHGWNVTVYCQICDPDHTEITEDTWRGVQRVNIPVSEDTAYGSMVFDRKSIRMALKRPGPCLVLGYNTAILTLALRLRGKAFVTNMDGIEWKRGKWSLPFKIWFYINDWIGSLASNHLIADHPKIAEHLESRTSRDRITMIPYGADHIGTPDPSSLRGLDLEPDRYMISICRPEPENSLLELVRAFSREHRGRKFVVLGKFVEDNPYHRTVRQAASDEVIFPGAIYDKPLLHALRGHTRAYCHGHTVGGTNPSLVEALGAGNPIIAHDNAFNRWVAGEKQFYFRGENACDELISEVLVNDERVSAARKAARARFQTNFTWSNILSQYETMLMGLQTEPTLEKPSEISNITANSISK